MITYRYANESDIELLVELRPKFLNIHSSDENYPKLKEHIYQYFKSKLVNDECVVLLAYDDIIVIGTGIIFFYDSIPSSFNITGKNVYITSMYVHEEYRRKKIGSTILTKLIEIAKIKAYPVVMLNASELGKKLYQKQGFVDVENGMIYKIET